MEILVDELGEDLWVATVKNRKLIGLEIDPYSEEVRAGTIYWAKVLRIDKALDAAFLLLDGENIGLLNNQDVLIKGKDGSYFKGGAKEIGKTLKAGDFIAVQAKNGVIPRWDREDDLPETEKAAKVSMDITLPGRYLIYAPMMAENRLSKRIQDKTLRKRLMTMIKQIPDIQGCILRAAAADVQTDMLIRESRILREIWDQIQVYMTGDDPVPIMLGPDALQRTLGDQAGQKIDTIDIVTMDKYQEVEEWCEVYAPDLVTKVTPVELPDQDMALGLFDYRGIMSQIDTLFQPYVLLKHGGNIIIQETAALIAIDINRGRDSRGNLAVNLEALQEIGKQIRLRNLGGIILMDLLKVKSKAEEEKILKALSELAAQDSTTLQIHSLTALGLAEITRARRSPPLSQRVEDIDL